MHKLDEVTIKKLNGMVVTCRFLFIFSSIFFSFYLSVVILGKVKFLNLIPVVLFVIVWYTMFYHIYSFLAYKISKEIVIVNGDIIIKCLRKEYIFKENDIIERQEGVNHIIIIVKCNRKTKKIYIPVYLSKFKTTNSKMFNNIPNVKKKKIYYDFFLKFHV